MNVAVNSAGDPTYDTAVIDANPEWRLAFWMSELDNDNAPLGWFRGYINLAHALLTRRGNMYCASCGVNIPAGTMLCLNASGDLTHDEASCVADLEEP